MLFLMYRRLYELDPSWRVDSIEVQPDDVAHSSKPGDLTFGKGSRGILRLSDGRVLVTFLPDVP
jgi:hypothetical protein